MREADEKTANPCPDSIFCVTIFIIELRDLRDFPGDIPECPFDLGVIVGQLLAFSSCCLFWFRVPFGPPRRRGFVSMTIRSTRNSHRTPTRSRRGRRLSLPRWKISTLQPLNCTTACESAK